MKVIDFMMICLRKIEIKRGFLTALIFSSVSAFSNPVIKICNFSGSSADIMLGLKNNPQIQINSLEHGEVTFEIDSVSPGEYPLYFRTGGELWLGVSDEYGEVLKSNFKSNHFYIIILGYSGIPQVIEISDKKTGNGSFYIFNETGREIGSLRVTDDWENGRKGLFLKNVKSGIFTGTHEVERGKWKIMWNYINDSREDRYYTCPDPDNLEIPLVIDYKSNVRCFLVVYRNLEGESTYLFR